MYAVASSDTTAKLTSNPASGGPTGGSDKRPTAGPLHLLEDENSRLRRLIAELRLDLELLKRVPGIPDRR